MFIAGRQGACGDQDGAQVLNWLAGGELVEGSVAEGPLAATEFAQDGGDGGLVHPRQHQVGSFAAGQGIVQAAQLGGDLTATRQQEC